MSESKSECSVELTAEQQNHGMRDVYIGASAGAILLMLLIRSAFGTLFVKHLGGSDRLAMLLGAIIGFARLLQIPVSLRVHPSSGKKFLLRCWLAYGIIMLAAALLPSVMGAGEMTARAMVLTIFIGVIVAQCGSTFWFPMLLDIAPAEKRGRFIGRMRACWSTAVFIAIVVSGLFLGKNPETWQFQAVMVVGVGFVFLRNIFASRIPVASKSLVDQDDFGDWKKHINSLLYRRDVIVFCLYFAMVGICIGFLGQPLVLYMKEMGFPTNENMIVFGFATLGMILSLLVGGQLVDRIGTKRVFLVAHIVLCVVCFAVVGVGMLPRSQARIVMPMALVLVGAARAVGFLACTTQLFHLAPDRGRAFFLCLANILVFAGPSVSMLTAAAILSFVPNGWFVSVGAMELNVFQFMLAMSGAALLVIAVLLRFVKDIRPERIEMDAE